METVIAEAGYVREILEDSDVVKEIGTCLNDEIEVRIVGTNDETAELLAQLLSNGWVAASFSTELDHKDGVSVWFEPISRNEENR